MTEKIQGSHVPTAHPEVGTIAAHADRRLVGDERTRMDEHLAECADCYEVFAETLKFASEEGAEAAPPGIVRARAAPLGALVRRPAFWMAAGLAAAALLIAVPLWVKRAGFVFLPASPVADLVAAVGERRLVEPRLTGGFRYARLLVMRSGEGPQGLDVQPPAVIAAVAKIRERADKDPSPEALGALGVTYLVSGDVASAVKSLESATTQAPENAQLWSDLAAAYLARAKQADEPADIPKALEAAERAIALPNPPVEAYFNRALALEALHLDDAAKKAWEDYLARDASSGWAEEARAHLEALKQVRQSTAEEDRARVQAALEQGAAAVERLADESPQALRDYVDDVLLPAWAEATLVGHPDANLHRDRARILGEALARTTTDVMTRDTARALAVPASASSRDPLRSQAQGLGAFFEARRLDDNQMPSCDQVRGAARDLEAGGSPYAAWARFQSVIACLYPSDPKGALVELDHLEALDGPRGYVQLMGRVRSMQGLVRAGQSELTASLDRYRSARDSFRATRDLSSEAKTRGLLAENLRFLGERRESWREYEKGLALIDYVRDSTRRYVMFAAGAQTCLYEGMPRASVHFSNAAVETAIRSSRAALVADALVRRARVLHRLGAEDRAASDLMESRRWIAGISNPSLAERAKAEANRTEGEILVRSQPEVASRSLGEALSYFKANIPLLVPPLYLLRSRAESAAGSDDAADRDLLAGIEAREQERAYVGDAALRVSFFDEAFPLFDDMVRLQITRRHDPARALEFVERSHARHLVDSIMGASLVPLGPDVLRQQLPARVALVYYAPLEDRLVAWVLTREALQFVERPVSSGELARRVAAYRAAIDNRALLPVVQQTAALLHDDLVRPLLPFLSGQDVLVFVPDGVLQSVPFASLWDRQTGHYLVEDYGLELAPSGTIFVLASRAATGMTGPLVHALVVGNPRIDRKVWPGLAVLEGAEGEATEVAGLYPRSELLTGAEATKAAFLEGSARSQVVHFAGHAAASQDLSSASRLLFAPDQEKKDSGALYLRELDRTKLAHTRVVVLAACRTGAGSVSRVEGALSLGRPFLAAGVPYVVASLWDIEDSVSRRLFVAFHRALLAGNDPVRALRVAQISFVHDSDPSSSHPASWAAFVSMGGLDPHSSLEGTAAKWTSLDIHSFPIGVMS